MIVPAMKYVFTGLVIIAAVAALFFRPPQLGAPAVPPSLGERGAGETAHGQTPAAPRASVTSTVVVYVAGEVLRPGVYRVRSDGRAVDALTRAGGALPDADLVAVNLAAALNDGDEIAVPKIGAVPPHGRRAAGGHGKAPHRPRFAARGHALSKARAAPAQSIDLNAAGPGDLEAVPGIGSALAARIVAYRALNGPFTSIDEVADISGITPRVQDALSEYTFVR